MILYWPASSVVTERCFSISAGLAASTVTPGSAPPVVSLTTPAIELCASAWAGNPSPTSNTMNAPAVRDIAPPDWLTDRVHAEDVNVSLSNASQLRFVALDFNLDL